MAAAGCSLPLLAQRTIDSHIRGVQIGVQTYSFRDLPLDRLLVETDAPYLAPVPYRGKRNEPAFVAATAAFVAELKGITAEQLAAVTTANFFRLFAKASPPQ